MITIMIIYSVNIIIFYQLINNHLSNGYIYIKLSNSKTDDSQNGAVVNRYNYPYISGRSIEKVTNPGVLLFLVTSFCPQGNFDGRKRTYLHFYFRLFRKMPKENSTKKCNNNNIKKSRLTLSVNVQRRLFICHSSER